MTESQNHLRNFYRIYIPRCHPEQLKSEFLGMRPGYWNDLDASLVSAVG
jgi:hypothetical protein